MRKEPTSGKCMQCCLDKDTTGGTKCEHMENVSSISSLTGKKGKNKLLEHFIEMFLNVCLNVDTILASFPGHVASQLTFTALCGFAV